MEDANAKLEPTKVDPLNNAFNIEFNKLTTLVANTATTQTEYKQLETEFNKITTGAQSEISKSDALVATAKQSADEALKRCAEAFVAFNNAIQPMDATEKTGKQLVGYKQEDAMNKIHTEYASINKSQILNTEKIQKYNEVAQKFDAITTDLNKELTPSQTPSVSGSFGNNNNNSNNNSNNTNSVFSFANSNGSSSTPIDNANAVKKAKTDAEKAKTDAEKANSIFISYIYSNLTDENKDNGVIAQDNIEKADNEIKKITDKMSDDEKIKIYTSAISNYTNAITYFNKIQPPTTNGGKRSTVSKRQKRRKTIKHRRRQQNNR